MPTNAPLLQPSGSALATAIAAAFNLVNPPRGGIIRPDGKTAEEAKKWAQLVGECAKIMHEQVAGNAAT